MINHDNLISIMMPAYNASQFIHSAILSVISQTYPNWELIIVNDGSTDDTAEIIKEFSDSRIKIFHQQNQGEASARNTALQLMEGEWIAFLDADDQFLPDFLEKMLAFLLSNQRFNAAYCDGWYVDTEGHRIEALSVHRRGPFEGNLCETLVRASDVFGPPTCTMVKRAVISSHRLTFDTNIVIGPDWDFFTHLAQFTEWGYLDFKGVNYRVHQTNITTRTGIQKRRESLALCRERAISLSDFENFSLATRNYVYYDLFVNLIFDQPDRVQKHLESQSFHSLPRASKARLIRLLAAKSMANFSHTGKISGWLKLSFAWNPFDRKTWLLMVANWISPNLAQKFLKKREQAVQSIDNTPFNLKN